MRRFASLKTLGILCMAGFLMTAPQVFAQFDDDFGAIDGGDTSNAEAVKADRPESEVIEELCKFMSQENHEKYPHRLTYDSTTKKWKAIVEKVKKDPFKPIVEKKVVLPPVRKVQETRPVENKKPAPPPVKPIKLFVTGIVGNEGSRLAIVKFENEEMTITKDQIVEGKFKVVDIYSDRVVIYSNKEQRRHTFKIGGDEKE